MFIAKNPIVAPKKETTPSSPPDGMRGLFPMADGWYDIDDNGNVEKIQKELTFDTTPTADSTNPVTSGGVKTELDKKADSGDVNALILADERLKYYGDKDIVPSDESWFTVNETGETITGLTEIGKTQTELVIPYKINGVEITTIRLGNEEGDEQYSALRTVKLPNSITTLWRGAFGGYTSLESIEIPNSVTGIGFGAFINCTSLESINIPSSVTIIENHAFTGCNNLTIYCEQGSYADIYVKARDIPIVYTDVKATSINPTVKTALEDTITVNTIYDLGVQTALTITLPSGQIGDFIQFDFISGSTATDLLVTPPTTLTINSSSGLVGFDLIPGTNTIYTLYFDWGETGLDGTDVTYGWRFNYSEYSITIA